MTAATDTDMKNKENEDKNKDLKDKKKKVEIVKLSDEDQKYI